MAGVFRWPGRRLPARQPFSGGTSALLIVAVVVIAFVRAIREWQQELDDYQRDLTEYRMNMADIRSKHQVKKDIIWDRH